jgi:ubiquinone/menaquinone biosynthesis C-methylase UbiE
MTIREAFLQNPEFILDDNVFFQKSFPHHRPFEKNYLAVRTQEQRLYDDDIVRRLPEIPKSHELKKEWAIRKISAKRLAQYLSIKFPKILEVGCGNGWLTNIVGKITNAEVAGLDINETELRQAARVFHAHSNITLVYADIFSFNVITRFDAIVLASALQYFPEPELLIRKLQHLLTANGEIHIIDTPFYDEAEISNAKKRTKKYFEQFNVSLPPIYYHHTWSMLNHFKSHIQHDPRSTWTKVKRLVVNEVSPFPWIIINK